MYNTHLPEVVIARKQIMPSLSISKAVGFQEDGFGCVVLMAPCKLTCSAITLKKCIVISLKSSIFLHGRKQAWPIRKGRLGALIKEASNVLKQRKEESP